MKLKILYFDIETAPTLGYLWHPAQGYVSPSQTLHEFFLLSWAAKWCGEKKIHSAVVTPKEAKDQDDERIISLLADLVRDADVVVGHNMDRFDLARVNSRVMLLGLEPLGPVDTIDTLKLAKGNFGFVHNKLDWLAQQLGLGNKIKTDFQLWKDCYFGSQKALNEMLRYNKEDVVLLEGVFEAMKPYVKSLRRLYEADEEGQVICPTCGAEGEKNFIARKYYRTKSGTYPQYQCVQCRRYHTSRKAIKETRGALKPR